MDPILGYGGMQLGGSLLQGLFGGPSKLEKQNLGLQNQLMQTGLKRGNQLWDILQGAKNNPGQFMQQSRMAIAPQMNKLSAQLSNRVGLDSAAASGELARYGQSQLAGQYNQYMQNLLALMGGLSR